MAALTAAVLAAVPAFSTSAAEEKMTKLTPVLADFNKNDVNGMVIVRMPAELTASADISFTSPEGSSIAYYKNELESSVNYCFEIEGRDNSQADYRNYMMKISFTDATTGASTEPLDLVFDIPDGLENPDSFTVYDYTFIADSEASESTFELIEDAPAPEKTGDIFYPSTFAVHIPGYIKGDINGDGKVTATDASAALVEYAVIADTGVETFNAREKAAGDINGDGKITATDASAILVYYAELSDKGTAEWR